MGKRKTWIVLILRFGLLIIKPEDTDVNISDVWVQNIFNWYEWTDSAHSELQSLSQVFARHKPYNQKYVAVDVIKQVLSSNNTY